MCVCVYIYIYIYITYDYSINYFKLMCLRLLINLQYHHCKDLIILNNIHI